MPGDVHACPDHGYYAARAAGPDRACPVCEATGRRVLSGERRRRLSKFCSGALRHFPADVGLALDDAGWTDAAGLAAAAARKYDWAGPDEVAAVVATDPKGRFEFDPESDRGGPDGDDSVGCDPVGGDSDDDGTAGDDSAGGGSGGDGPGGRDPAGDGTAFAGRVRAAYGHSVDVDLERRETPVPAELYHGTDRSNLDAILAEGLRPMGRQQVHLSGSVERAREVGRRHAPDPVVLAVDAAGLRADGHEVTKRGRSVYTTDRVPPPYLRVHEAEGGE